MYKSKVKKRGTHARAHKAQREKKGEISVCEKMVNLLNFLFECSLKQLN